MGRLYFRERAALIAAAVAGKSAPSITAMRGFLASGRAAAINPGAARPAPCTSSRLLVFLAMIACHNLMHPLVVLTALKRHSGQANSLWII